MVWEITKTAAGARFRKVDLCVTCNEPINVDVIATDQRAQSAERETRREWISQVWINLQSVIKVRWQIQVTNGNAEQNFYQVVRKKPRAASMIHDTLTSSYSFIPTHSHCYSRISLNPTQAELSKAQKYQCESVIISLAHQALADKDVFNLRYAAGVADLFLRKLCNIILFHWNLALICCSVQIFVWTGFSSSSIVWIASTDTWSYATCWALDMWCKKKKS